MGLFGGFQTHNHQSIGEGGSLPDPGTDQVTGLTFSTTSTTFVEVTGSSLTPTIRDGRYCLLTFKATFVNTLGSGGAAVALYRDGVKIPASDLTFPTPVGEFAPVCLTVLDGPMVGDQTPDYDVRVLTGTNTLQIYSGGPYNVAAGTFTALEVGRP